MSCISCTGGAKRDRFSDDIFGVYGGECNTPEFLNNGVWLDTFDKQYFIIENNIEDEYIFKLDKSFGVLFEGHYFVRSGRFPLLTTITTKITTTNNITGVSEDEDEAFLNAFINQYDVATRLNMRATSVNNRIVSKYCDFSKASNLDACAEKYAEVVYEEYNSTSTIRTTYSFYNDSCGRYFDVGRLGYVITPKYINIQLAGTEIYDNGNVSERITNDIILTYQGNGKYLAPADSKDFSSLVQNNPVNFPTIKSYRTNECTFEFKQNTPYTYIGFTDVAQVSTPNQYNFTFDYYKSLSEVVYTCFSPVPSLINSGMQYNNILLGANYENDMSYIENINCESLNVNGFLNPTNNYYNTISASNYALNSLTLSKDSNIRFITNTTIPLEYIRLNSNHTNSSLDYLNGEDYYTKNGNKIYYTGTSPSTDLIINIDTGIIYYNYNTGHITSNIGTELIFTCGRVYDSLSYGLNCISTIGYMNIGSYFTKFKYSLTGNTIYVKFLGWHNSSKFDEMAFNELRLRDGDTTNYTQNIQNTAKYAKFIINFPQALSKRAVSLSDEKTIKLVKTNTNKILKERNGFDLDGN